MKEYTIIDNGKLLKVYEKISYAKLILHILDEKIDRLKALKEEYNKGFKEGTKKYGIWLECIHCHQKILVPPNSKAHLQIIKFLKKRGWGHSTCHNNFQRADKRRST